MRFDPRDTLSTLVEVIQALEGFFDDLRNAEKAFAIAVDSAGSAYVTGATKSTDFPIKNAFQATLHGTRDAFVARSNGRAGPMPAPGATATRDDP